MTHLSPELPELQTVEGHVQGITTPEGQDKPSLAPPSSDAGASAATSPSQVDGEDRISTSLYLFLPRAGEELPPSSLGEGRSRAAAEGWGLSVKRSTSPTSPTPTSWRGGARLGYHHAIRSG